MRLFPMLIACAVMWTPAAFAQIKASGAEMPQEFASPMDLEIPLSEVAISGEGTWVTDELKGYVCSAVSIQTLWMTQKRIEKRGKPGEVELTFGVSVFTKPPQDMLAKITFAFKNDNEELRRLFMPGHRPKPLVIDAEETKRRNKTVTFHANLEDFLRVLNGPNPRLLIHVTVVPN